MRLIRTICSLTALGLVVSACVPTTDGQIDDGNAPDQTSTIPATENSLSVELGVAPGEQPIATTFDFDTVEVWCDEGLAYLSIGDLWETETGPGFVLRVAPEVITLNEPLEMPFSQDTGVVFLVDPDAPEGVPQEYASSEEESGGTIQFEAVPCDDNGDNFAFTVSGSLGAETYPGYESKASIQGQFNHEMTSEPAWFNGLDD